MRHPRPFSERFGVHLFLGAFYAAVAGTAMLIFGTQVAWLVAAVPWVGTLIFVPVTTWLESEEQARRKRVRGQRRASTG